MTCRCPLYRFPHRMMGGRCNGGAFVHAVFEAQAWGACRDCWMREARTEEEGGLVCTVLDGREPELKCPELQEHIRYHGIKLYGVNKPE